MLLRLRLNRDKENIYNHSLKILIFEFVYQTFLFL